MKTKVIILSVLMVLIPSVSHASSYKAPKKVYTYKVKTAVHFYCPYKGCSKSFKKY